jgi:transcription elongation factor GreB
VTERDDEEPKTAHPNYITPAGYERLAQELGTLGAERSRVVIEVTAAAAQGDRSENAEYLYGKRRLRQIDSRMRFLRKRLEIAVPIDPGTPRGDRIFFGATVVLEDEDGKQTRYQLVGEDEVDATSGRISWRSPVGRALIGRTLDDEVRVETPGGVRLLTVADVSYRR